MPCLKYSVPTFVEQIYKMQLQRLAVRYDHYRGRQASKGQYKPMGIFQYTKAKSITTGSINQHELIAEPLKKFQTSVLQIKPSFNSNQFTCEDVHIVSNLQETR